MEFRLKTDTHRRNLLSQLYVSACNSGPQQQNQAASIGSEEEDYVQYRLSPVLNQKVRFSRPEQMISPKPSKETFHLPPLKVLQQQPRTKQSQNDYGPIVTKWYSRNAL